MKRFYCIAGKLIGYLCLVGVLFGLCVLDAVPQESLSLFLLILLGMGGGCAAGAYIWYLGDRQ